MEILSPANVVPASPQAPSKPYRTESVLELCLEIENPENISEEEAQEAMELKKSVLGSSSANETETGENLSKFRQALVSATCKPQPPTTPDQPDEAAPTSQASLPTRISSSFSAIACWNEGRKPLVDHVEEAYHFPAVQLLTSVESLQTPASTLYGTMGIPFSSHQKNAGQMIGVQRCAGHIAMRTLIWRAANVCNLEKKRKLDELCTEFMRIRGIVASSACDFHIKGFLKALQRIIGKDWLVKILKQCIDPGIPTLYTSATRTIATLPTATISRREQGETIVANSCNTQPHMTDSTNKEMLSSSKLSRTVDTPNVGKLHGSSLFPRIRQADAIELFPCCLSRLNTRHLCVCMAVGKQWRDRILSLPALWGKLMFPAGCKVNMECISRLMRYGGSTVKDIDLSNCPEITWKAIKSELPRCPSLHTLRLGEKVGVQSMSSINTTCGKLQVLAPLKVPKRFGGPESDRLLKFVEVPRDENFNSTQPFHPTELDASTWTTMSPPFTKQLFAELLPTHPSLRSLRLPGLKPEDAQLLAKALKTNTSLTSLNLLGSVHITLEGAQAVIAVFRRSATLQTICGLDPGVTHADFTRQELKPWDGPLLTADLQKGAARSSLCSLDLRGGATRCLSRQDARDLAASITERLGQWQYFCGISLARLCSHSLTEADLSGSRFDAVGAMVLAKYLTSNGTLTALNLSGAGFGPEGLQVIADVLLSPASGTHMLALKVLVLDRNGIGGGTESPAACTALGTAVWKNLNLQRLDLSNNGLTTEDMKALIDSGVLHGALSHLDISENCIKEPGAEVIAQALLRLHPSRIPTMAHLDTRGNGICAEAATTLGAAVAAQPAEFWALMNGIPLRDLSIPGRVVTLDLSREKLDDTSATILFKCLAENTTLRTLTLTGNRIEQTGAKALAQLLVWNNTLTTLCTWGNPIADEGAKQLTAAALMRSSPARLCGSVLESPTGRVDLSHQGLQGPDAALLAYDLMCTASLTSLNVLHNKFDRTAVRALVERFENHRTVNTLCGIAPGTERLDMAGRGLQPADGLLLVADLRKRLHTERLHTLDLSNNRLGACGKFVTGRGDNDSETLGALAQALGSCPSVTAVYLSQNLIGPIGLEAIALGLATNTTMRVLRLDSNYVSGQEHNARARRGVEFLGRALRSNRTLTSLSLAWNYLGPASAALLVDAVACNQALALLNMWGNRLEVSGVRALIGAAQRRAEAMPQSAPLCLCGDLLFASPPPATLDLPQQSLGPADSMLLCHDLTFNTSITRLDLSNNGIGGLPECEVPEGAEAIMQALKYNRVLTELNLSNNMIGCKGANLIGKGLLCNRTLKVLNLSVNVISMADVGRGDDPEGFLGLALGLLRNEVLTNLDLSDTGMGPMGAAALSEMLTARSMDGTLVTISVLRNQIGEEGRDRLLKALEQNLCLNTLCGIRSEDTKLSAEDEKLLVREHNINAMHWEPDSLCF
ncbi:hypothetical protein CYMTET_14916 [Cymbomonas tetramitiformis]|uniref:Uncharacterized protein n=1 Tax=Cymbomonas tetramitiformis TaxID=36881 RepID=A0AAE0L9P6_9CHLO|nr:hypothetical protein CYMTET_14916 [Cymbomonas tetramitiformis]